MLLYHGSKESDIERFELMNRKCPNLDFGKGVYFTSCFEQAKKWACRGKTPGIVYECDVDLSKLTTLSLERAENEDLYYVLYMCRIGLEDIVSDAVDGFDDADVIYGRMLDGRVKNFERYAEMFNEGEMPFEEFKHRTKLYGGDWNQYCFKSDSALELINAGYRKIYLVEERDGECIVTETFDLLN